MTTHSFRHNRFTTIVVLALFCMAMLPGLAHAAKVTYLVRPVEVLPVGTNQWKPLNIGDDVVEGDSVRTGSGGRAELTITEKRVLRVGQASEIKLDQLLLKDNDLVGKFKVVLGRFWTSILKPLRQVRGEAIIVETPTVTLGVKGTRFNVDYDSATRRMQSTVLEGTVIVNPVPEPTGPPTEISGPREIAPPQQISQGEWTLLVSADQKLIFIPGQDPILEPITDEDLADEWVIFNNARDEALQ